MAAKVEREAFVAVVPASQAVAQAGLIAGACLRLCLRAGQVPGELLPAAGEPRVRVDKPHLRVLRRVQAAV